MQVCDRGVEHDKLYQTILYSLICFCLVNVTFDSYERVEKTILGQHMPLAVVDRC